MGAGILSSGVRFMIAQNPRVIQWSRVTSVQDPATGGLKEQTTQVGPFTVRIYAAGSSVQPSVTDEEPGLYRTTMWNMLLDETVDLPNLPLIDDEFDIPDLGHFLVKSVTPWWEFGQRVGTKVALQRRA